MLKPKHEMSDSSWLVIFIVMFLTIVFAAVGVYVTVDTLVKWIF
jgi:hypothetical protein